ncbi:uncharacterized protein LOC110694787 [Chenopodium quinoa]|uniref:uncharacterized protein LOC110694787 n=1 Tax=Chenopodium quinoa TaxID=63459 RepID=UPI000B781A5D|nr:uncharacterized protein LOC110694787 [Chenopodium quinoa]
MAHTNPRSEEKSIILISSDTSNTTSLTNFPPNLHNIQTSDTSSLPKQSPFIANTCSIIDEAVEKPLGEDELLSDEDRSDSEGTPYLADEDCDDRDDDDLFQQYIDDEEDDNENGIELHDDVVLNVSDDEVVSLVGSDDEGPNYPVFNPQTDFRGRIELSKGLKFPSNIVFRKALRHHAIKNGYDYYYLHNNRTKRDRVLECKCKDRRKCRFKVYCKLKDEETWQIKSIRLRHICSHHIHNTKLSSQYLAERYLKDWRDNPSMKLQAFMKRARREIGVEIGYYMAYYAKAKAFKMIFGDANLEYSRVWDYAATIMRYNPGSTAKVKFTGIENPPPLFQRLYIFLQACKEGFMAGCRSILGVDGAHLRGPYPGILLIAIGKDGNKNIFPVAWAVVETENSENCN